MKQAAGLLVFRKQDNNYEVLLTHPGGPFWAKKDVWSIPKGELEDGEEPRDALRREFLEEIGIEPPMEGHIDLGKAKSSKVNYIWAVEADLDITQFHCDSTVTMVWPPRSGQEVTFPECDRVAWFELRTAYAKAYKSHAVFIERLAEHLKVDLNEAPEPEPANPTLF